MSYLSVAVSIVFALFLTPFVTRSVGPLHYGTWAFAGSAVGYIALLDFGIAYGLTRYTARLEALGDPITLVELASSALAAYTLLAAVGGGVVLLLFWRAGAWLGHSLGDTASARAVILILGANSCLSLPLGLFTGILKGRQSFSFLALTDILATCINGFLVVIVLEVHADIVGLAFCTFLANIVRGACQWNYLRTSFPGLRLAWRSPLKARAFLGYSGAAFIVSACAQVVFASDLVIVGGLISVAAVAVYAVAQKLVSAITTITFQGIDALLPVLTRLDTQSQDHKMQELFYEGVVAGLIVVLPFTMCVGVFGGRILAFWAGASYGSGHIVLLTLAIALLFHVPGHVAAIVLLSLNRHRVLAAIAMADAVANLALSLVLARAFGPVGVAAATAVTMLLSNMLVVPAYTCRVLAIHPTNYVRRCLLPVGRASVLPAGTCFGLLVFPSAWGQVSLLLSIVGTACVTGLSFWYIALTSEQRTRYRSFAQGLLQGRLVMASVA